MGAARKFRQLDEDADDSHYVWAAEPTGDDALDHAVAPEDVWPAWRCDGCGQHWDGARYSCGYCGTVRADADTLCG